MPLKLYGFSVSQPARAAYWAMLAEGTQFEFESVVPGKGTRTKEYKEGGSYLTVPRLQDGDFVLNESHAIMTYLGEKEEWALYPKDLKVRAKVQEYFNWHHGNTRKITVAYFAPVIRKDLKFPPGLIEAETFTATSSLKALERLLSTQPFITGSVPTIADISAFCEVSQAEPEMFNLTSLEPYPNIRAWLERCKTQIPKYKEAHAAFFKIHPKLKGAFNAKM